MIMILKVLPTGMFGSNTYIVGDNGEGIIIDGGVDTDDIVNALKDLNLNIKFVILTHGHIDHICNAEKYRSRLGVPIYIHEADSDYLKDPDLNASGLMGINLSIASADKLLSDGDVLKAGGLEFEILHTPGHTPGCICIKVEKMLFSG
ncbi:MAG: fold metallo-hydrolase, partial [Clostridiales bacterium]|nr:fold metallo-hydrolase [Clostridiales bacterium]